VGNSTLISASLSPGDTTRLTRSVRKHPELANSIAPSRITGQSSRFMSFLSRAESCGEDTVQRCGRAAKGPGDRGVHQFAPEGVDAACQSRVAL